MTFMEVMVAATIMFTGAVVMITVLPKLIEAGYSRSSRDMSYIFGMSKMDEIMASPYSTITSGSGSFTELMPDVPEAYNFEYQYTATEVTTDNLPTDLLKRVTLVITWGDDSDKSDTYVFYMADKGDD